MISIVIPNYKKLELLYLVLDCLNRQSDKNFEVIVSDDGTPIDDLQRFVDTNSFEFPIKFIWQRDEGCRISKARNNGILQATSDLLLIMDNDIFLPFNFIKTIRHYEGRYNMNIISPIWSCVDMSDNDKMLKTDDRFTLIETLNSRLYHNTVFVAMWIISKDLVYEVSGFDELYDEYGYEDLDFRLRVDHFLEKNGKRSEILELPRHETPYVLHDHYKVRGIPSEHVRKRFEQVQISKIHTAKFGLDNLRTTISLVKNNNLEVI